MVLYRLRFWGLAKDLHSVGFKPWDLGFRACVANGFYDYEVAWGLYASMNL